MALRIPKFLWDLFGFERPSPSDRRKILAYDGADGYQHLSVWEAGGVYVGSTQPAQVSYAEWLATGTGYWAWIDISGAVGGSTPQPVSVAVSSSGGVVTGSAVSVLGLLLRAVSVGASGGAVFGGSGSISASGLHSVNAAGNGGAVAGGSAAATGVLVTSVSVGSAGGAVVQGTATITYTASGPQSITVVSDGGGVIGGFVIPASGTSAAASGGAVVSGKSLITGLLAPVSGVATSSGGAVVSGRGVASLGVVVVSAGGAIVSGSSMELGTVAPSRPDAPTGLVLATASGSITPTWTAVSGATSYNVYWRAGADPVIGGGGTTKITGATSGTAITGLTDNGTIYHVAVTAVNAQGESGLSAVATATAAAPVVAPPFTFEGATGGTYGPYHPPAASIFYDGVAAASTDYAYSGSRSLKLSSGFSATADEDGFLTINSNVSWWESPPFNTGSATAITFWARGNSNTIYYDWLTPPRVSGTGGLTAWLYGGNWTQITLPVPSHTDIKFQLAVSDPAPGWEYVEDIDPSRLTIYVDDVAFG